MKKLLLFACLLTASFWGASSALVRGDELQKLDVDRGIVVVVGAPDASRILQYAKKSQLMFYVQSDRPSELSQLRKVAEQSGLLGRRIYVESGRLDLIHLWSEVRQPLSAYLSTDTPTPLQCHRLLDA